MNGRMEAQANATYDCSHLDLVALCDNLLQHFPCKRRITNRNHITATLTL